MGAPLRWAWLWLCLLAAVTAGAQETYKLSPGDKLELVILALPQLEKTYQIRADGEFYHPELGQIKAAGKTLGQLQRELRPLLERRLRSAEFRLGLVERGRKEIAVLGEVKKPGKYAMEPGSTVLDALAQAEGLSDRADPQEGLLYRDGSARPIALSPPPPGSPEVPPSLQVGDVVYVVAGARISVTGEVVTPGIHSVTRQGADARMALERAGGLKPEAALTRVLLIRPSLPKAVLLDVTPGVELPPEARSLQDGDALIANPRQAIVLGAVNKAVALKGGENLLDVFLASGGPVQYRESPLSLLNPYGYGGYGAGGAYLDEIRIIRSSDRAKGLERAEAVDLEAYMEEGDPKALVPIYDGDVIYIPAAHPSNFNLYTILSLISLIRGLGGW